MTAPKPASAFSADSPLRLACVVFPGFTALDLFGPLGALNSLSLNYPMTISLVSADMNPVSIDRIISADGVVSGRGAASASPFFSQAVLPTHTFADVSGKDFDAVLVPGGGGTRDPETTQPIVDWLARVMDGTEEDWSPRYIMSVCTGAALLARTGKIGGKSATSNKLAFGWVKSQPGAEDVNWVAKARWVVDGKLWTSAGVSAGTDMTLGWIEAVYGREESERIRINMEWNKLEKDEDPYAVLYGLA